jgi:O-antigen/teichoic acid export membrane protein
LKTHSKVPFQLLKEVWLLLNSRERLKSALNTPLYLNSIYLIVNAAAHSGLGFIFWVVVARQYSAEDLGLSSALLAAGTLLSYIASLGLGLGLIRFLPYSGPEAPRLINSCFILSALAAVILSTIFLIGLPLWSPVLSFVWQNYAFIAVFLAFVATATMLERLAEVFIALRRAKFVLLHYGIANIMKVILVFILANFFSVFGIFTSVFLGIAVALAVGVLLSLPKVMPSYRLRPNVRDMLSHERFRFSFANYISQVLWIAPTWVLPIMVANLLGAQNNAYFYISWSIAMLLFSIPYSVSSSLFAEGSHMEMQIRNQVIKSLKFMVILFLAIPILVIFSGKILLFFGSEYSIAGEKLLWVLLPTAIPLAVNTIYLSITRIQRRFRGIILVSAGVSLGGLAISYVLMPYLGIMGAGVGWLASNTIVSLIAFPKIVTLLKSEATSTN